MRGKIVEILHPLAFDTSRRAINETNLLQFSRHFISVHVQRRHINTRHTRKAAQGFLPRRPFWFRLPINVHEPPDGFLSLADDKRVNEKGKRLRVERRAGTARDDQRRMFAALRRQHGNTPNLQHIQQMKIIHLKRNGKADDGEIRKRRLRLHAQERRLRAPVLVKLAPVGQKKTLARRIRPAVQNAVNDM